MKKIVVFISFFLASLAGFSQIKDGFARSESGVWYKIETKNPKGRAVVEGDIVIGKFPYFLSPLRFYLLLKY